MYTYLIKFCICKMLAVEVTASVVTSTQVHIFFYFCYKFLRLSIEKALTIKPMRHNESRMFAV